MHKTDENETEQVYNASKCGYIPALIVLQAEKSFVFNKILVI